MTLVRGISKYIHMTRFDPPPLKKIPFLQSLARLFIKTRILTAAPEVAGSIPEVSRKLIQLMIEKPAVPEVSRSMPEVIRKLFLTSTNKLNFTSQRRQTLPAAHAVGARGTYYVPLAPQVRATTV